MAAPATRAARASTPSAPSGTRSLPPARRSPRREPGTAAMATSASLALAAAAAAALGGCGQGAHRGERITPAPLEQTQDGFVRVVRTVSPQVVQIQSARGLGS